MNMPEEGEVIKQILKETQFPVVVDLGAYHGEDSRWMRAACAGRSSRFVLVEADLKNWSSIPKDFGTVLYGAIHSYTGFCDFWECHSNGGDASGSIRKPTGHKIRTPQLTWNLTRDVPCFSLDFLFKEYELGHIDILWTDLQGAERDMIIGGKLALTGTRYMFIEAEKVESYEGQALRHELLELLSGWETVREFDFNLLLRNTNYGSTESNSN